jgi:phospholipid/cholesterol/gamma-HCH transport system substrate-binding protein
MERDVRYLTVGLVVLVLLAASLGFALWQSGGLEGAARDRYTVEFPGGVSGLSQGSGVRYRGVEVGRVTAVRMVADRPEVIRVDIAVRRGTPVTAETVARIRPKGITGLSYIGLTTPAPGPPPQQPAGARYPIIPAEPSQIDRLTENLPGMAEDLARVADRLEQALSADNLKRIDRILARSAELSGRLNTLAERAEGSLGEVDRTARSTRETLARVREVAPQAEQTLQALHGLSERLDGLARRSGPEVERFAEQGLPELRDFLSEGRRTLRAVRELARSLREDPGQVLAPPETGGKEVPQ